jgi:hypothetical protein
VIFEEKLYKEKYILVDWSWMEIKKNRIYVIKSLEIQMIVHTDFIPKQDSLLTKI